MSADTVDNLGTLLRRERRARKLSQRQAALAAGVARATLNRWEQGAHQPRLPELNAVLDALDASPVLRAQALALIPAPRALHSLREERTRAAQQAPEDAWIFTPEAGDLLRAMRLRQDMTQEYVAQQMGVRHVSVSRWETGERIPSSGHREELLRLLGALPEEKDALLQSGLLPARLGSEAGRSVEAVNERFIHVLWGAPDPRVEALKDLEFLRLERAFADLAAHSLEARHCLISAYSFHAQWLAAQHRYREAGVYADRSLEAAHNETLPNSDWRRSILVAAQCAAHGEGGRARPERGIQMLQDWLPLVQEPEYEAWILSDVAQYMAQAGNVSSALETMARACRVALRCENLSELRLRRVDQAEMLLLTGQPPDAERALGLLSAAPALNPRLRLREALCWSRGLLAVGETAEARRWLERAQEEAQTNGLSASEVQALARQFASR